MAADAAIPSPAYGQAPLCRSLNGQERVSSSGPERRSRRLTPWSPFTSGGRRERLTWTGGASDRREPHARDIALRRRAEQATVLPTALRRALVPYAPAGAARVEVLVQHQLPCLLQTQLLLVLQRAHTRERA